MATPEDIIENFKRLLRETPKLINASGLKDIYIMEKMGLKRNSYYRKKKEPHLFTLDELDKLYSIIGRHK